MHPNLLDQLRVFEAIAEEGSFSAAAKQLHRTVSAVGYSITQLEEQLGLSLFDRTGYRPILTDEGKSLLRDAAVISRRIERFSARADALKHDITVNVTILVEPFFPTEPLGNALGQFAKNRPQMQISILETAPDAMISSLAEGKAHIGLLSLSDTMPMRNFDGRQIALRGALPVAAPMHPLAQKNAPFALGELDNHRQIILSRLAVDESRYNYHVHVTDLWAVNTIDLARAALLAGAGWAYMPHHHVTDDLASGKLIALNCADIKDWAILRYSAIWQTNNPPDEALVELIDLIEAACTDDKTITGLAVG